MLNLIGWNCGGSRPTPCCKSADINTISVGADIIRLFFKKAPLLKGAVTEGDWGILYGLPAEFYRMGLTPFRPRCGHLPSRGGHLLGGMRRRNPPGSDQRSEPPPFDKGG